MNNNLNRPPAATSATARVMASTVRSVGWRVAPHSPTEPAAHPRSGAVRIRSERASKPVVAGLAAMGMFVTLVGGATLVAAQDFPELPSQRPHEVAPIDEDARVPVPQLVDDLPALLGVRPMRLDLVVPIQVVPGWAAPLDFEPLNLAPQYSEPQYSPPLGFDVRGMLLDEVPVPQADPLLQADPLPTSGDPKQVFVQIRLPDGLFDRPVHQLELREPIVVPDAEEDAAAEETDDTATGQGTTGAAGTELAPPVEAP